MRTYEILGENISEIAQKMVVLANESGERVVAEFNGIELEANVGDNPDSIEEFYDRELAYRCDILKESPEGQCAIRREESIDRHETWEASPECQRQRTIRESRKSEYRREMLKESLSGREYDENF